MKAKDKKKLQSILASVVILLIIFVLDKTGVINIQNNTEGNDAYVNISNVNTDENLYEVVRVVDGDTFVINYNGNNEKVRLIGVDTPESVHPDSNKNTKDGITASEYTKSMLSGKYVSLELDVQERDKYGRILAYVYLDGQMYNKMLLKEGYAKVAIFPPNVKYVEEFKNLQEEAIKNKVGLWKD